ncbi:MAG: 50S ribosomal protein L9 [Phycisphaerae bacterium]|nr:50S ribosomal protein L9 [Phycisphaerae bacterium]
MKVLLCQDVDRLGWLGDVVEVKNGYARNYLLPYGIAMVPNEGNIRSLAEAKAKKAKERKLVHAQLERAAEAVKGAEVVIAAKANEQGHLFGSVTERDIAENLREQGFEIADSMVKLSSGHIKEVGTQEVTIKLAAELKATVTVVVVPLNEGVESDDSNDENGDE